MRRLVVHIGMHKTGTTSIQRMLNRDRIALMRQGIYVPLTGKTTPKSAHHNLASALVGDVRFDPSLGSVDDFVAEVSAIEAPTVVITSERFDQMERVAANYRSLGDLAERLSRDLVVIAFVRDHVSAMNSHYAQNVKTFKHANPFDTMLPAELLNPYWRYRDLFAGFENVADRLVLLPYAGDTMRSFCEALAMEMDVTRHINRNLSVGPKTIEASRILFRNQGVPNGPRWDGKGDIADFLSSFGLRRAALAAGWDAEPYWGFTPEAARAVHDSLGAADRDFLARYGIFFGPPDPGVTRNDVTLENLPNDEGVEMLRVVGALTPQGNGFQE